MKPFKVQIGEVAQRQLQRCRVSIRASVLSKLQAIVEDLSVGAAAQRRPVVSAGPPHRFYVWEGMRVSYQVNAVTRRVTVLELRAEPA